MFLSTQDKKGVHTLSRVKANRDGVDDAPCEPLGK